MSLTDNEIIQDLEEFINRNENTNYVAVSMEFLKYTLDFINRLQAEKEALIAGQETLQKALEEKNAEIENLKEKIIEDDKLLNDRVVESVNAVSKAHLRYENALEEQLKTVKAEAIKKFAERLKKHRVYHLNDLDDDGDPTPWIDPVKIDNLVKEMVGDANIATTTETEGDSDDKN